MPTKTTTKNTATPLYALAGAGDLAVEKLRAVSGELGAKVEFLSAKLKDQKAVQAELGKAQTKAQTEFAKAQAELTKRFEALASDAKTVPAQLRELPAAVQAGLTTVLGEAETQYDKLANRGQQLVTRIRTQKATEDLEAQAKSTVTKVKATRTSTRKAAETATRSAKATTTSARKTAKTAAKATADAAAKVGD